MLKDFIQEVIEAEVSINEDTLYIEANGLTYGSHATPRLVRRIYVAFPYDGIQEYDFYVDVPDEHVFNDMKICKVSHTWTGFPKELKGIRIIAKTNKVEVYVKSIRQGEKR